MELKAILPTTSALIALVLGAPLQAADTDAKTGSRGPKKISECQTIHKPGSYAVTKNLTINGEDCLVITADNVTLDLGGFVVQQKDSWLGVGIKSQSDFVTIRNGVIDNFGTGILLADTVGAVVENVRLIYNFRGMRVGRNSLVRSNVVTRHEEEGIDVGRDSVVTDNVVNGNSGNAEIFGIRVGPGSLVSGNTANINSDGIVVGEGSTVVNNVARSNNALDEEFSGIGIDVDCPSAVIGNTATSNDINLVFNGDGCVDVNNVAP